MRHFLRTLRWAAAGGSLWAGCEGGHGQEPVPPVVGPTTAGLYGSLSCDGERWRPLAGFRPAESWEYVSLRASSAGSEVVVRDELGEPCGNAARRERCETALVLTQGQADGEFLLGTQAGDVRSFSAADMLDFFATIDSADEALWLARASHPELLPCSPTLKVTASVPGYRITFDAINAGPPCRETPGARADLRVGYLVAPDGTIERLALPTGAPNDGCPVPGRRPNGLCFEPRRVAHESLGALLAREAHAEAASVWAFEALARELQAHGAPSALSDFARRASREEASHAYQVARLARRYGGRPRLPCVPPSAHRSLRDLTLDNASEGCVRETYAALRVAYQSRRAQDPSSARIMARLARDELGHASWSFALARWAEPRLSVSARRRARDARKRALQELALEVCFEYDSDAQQLLGYPSRGVARHLVAAVAEATAAL